jgi:hypothetical protein
MKSTNHHNLELWKVLDTSEETDRYFDYKKL